MRTPPVIQEVDKVHRKQKRRQPAEEEDDDDDEIDEVPADFQNKVDLSKIKGGKQLFENIYASFVIFDDERRNLYKVAEHTGRQHVGSPFRTVDRLKLTLSILEQEVARVRVGISICTWRTQRWRVTCVGVL